MLTESEIKAYTVDIPNDIQAAQRASGCASATGSAAEWKLRDCACCGCKPAVRLNEDDSGAKAVECACGRRTSWSVLGQQVVEEWNRDFGVEHKSYRCKKCGKTTELSKWDIWGKVIRCVHCTAILMDNRHTLPPNAPGERLPGQPKT